MTVDESVELEWADVRAFCDALAQREEAEERASLEAAYQRGRTDAAKS